MRSLVPGIAVVLLATAACSETSGRRPYEPTPASPTGSGLSEPYAYITPTPAKEATPVDGEYQRKITPELAGPSGACRRCPPYRMEESAQTLRLEKGVFFIENEVVAPKSIDWRSIGHYTVEGDTLRLFNDPNCPTVEGRYRWSVTEGALALELVSDECAFGGLRWRYLTAVPWTAV